MIDVQTKVQAAHRKRNAYLYIRQSTPRQVLEHQESTQRQYGLRQQALRLGWSEEQIVVIDTDLGQSGASAADRAGFQQLVTEVWDEPDWCSGWRSRGSPATAVIGIDCWRSVRSLVR